jgi:hypothetical protein
MPRHNFEPPRGRVEYLEVESTAIACNLLGDPVARTVGVYLPDGYDRSDSDYPLFVCLAGFTSGGLKATAWQSFGESLPQRIDRLIAEGQIGPVITVFPDCFTSLGGNQYVNSSAMGNWEDFLLREMIPAVEQRYRVKPGPAHRAVFGKSSGGYGSLIQGLRHGECWAGLASHSGDVGFDIIYRRDLPMMLGQLVGHDFEPLRFVDALREARKIRGEEMHALMVLAMAASYDPDPAAPLGIRLPVDPETCELIEDRWANWLAHDPLMMIDREECQASLRKVGTVFIDCGARDQFYMQYPTRSLVRRMTRLGIAHIHEEFDDTHSGIDYRLERSLPQLYKAVSASGSS